MADLTDDELLDSVAQLWQELDPPPADLAEGVLSRLAAADLDVELLTLVESAEPAGVRSISTTPQAEETGTWSLEYTGPEFRVHVRIAKVDGIARVDGWVVPARPLTVRISTERPYRVLQQAEVDWRGRFELVGSPTGLCRLLFINDQRPGERSEQPPKAAGDVDERSASRPASGGVRPHATPPFWI